MLELPESDFEVGVDECGRGSLAGPVAAGAVCWDLAFLSSGEFTKELSQIRDSKRLSPKKRKALSEFIKQHAYFHGVAFVSANVIDTRNILQSTYDAMHGVLDQFFESQKNTDPRFVLIRVDGDRFRKYKDVHHVCCVRGDDKYLSVASASIIAKVARDEYMESRDCADKYDWKNNKGYGTAKHRDAILAHGVVPDEHRTTFLNKNMINYSSTL